MEEQIEFKPKSIGMYEDVYNELTKLKDKLELKNKRPFSYADVIKILLEERKK